MTQRSNLVRSSSLAVVLVAAASTALAGGGPFITVEMPAVSFDKSSQDAALVVRAQDCGVPANFEVVGFAEGLVAGERQSIRLTLRSTSRPGTYAVERAWPAEGRWILTFSTAERGAATTVVHLPESADGKPDIRHLHRRVARTEIDDLLAGKVALKS